MWAKVVFGDVCQIRYTPILGQKLSSVFGVFVGKNALFLQSFCYLLIPGLKGVLILHSDGAKCFAENIL